MVHHVTGVSIDGMQGVLLYMINNSMRELDNSHHFVVRVSPDDYEEISKDKDKIYGALNPGIELEIFEDAKLSKMQCLIETDNGIVDVSLDAQLDNLVKVLKLMIKE
jgi:flagellar assembly protein FliH